MKNLTIQSQRVNDACQYSSSYGKLNTWERRKAFYKEILVRLFHDRYRGLCDKECYEGDITEALIYILPHGSGIDADWDVEYLKNGNIICRNAYHCMNQSGFYDGWIDFRVKLMVKEGVVIDFTVTGAFHLRWNKYAFIKQCLENDMAYALKGVIS